MQDWEKSLQGLREQFIRGSAERLARIARALEHLNADKSDLDVLRELRTEFHGFSGLGGTYGFPQVTAAGLQGERQCDLLLSSETVPSGADVEAWRALLDLLRSQIGGWSPGRPSDSPGPVSGDGPRILLIMGDTEVAGLLSRLAEGDGLSVQTVTTCAAARDAIVQAMPAMVVVDFSLPDGSGLSLVERIRSTPGGETVPILVLSGVTSLPDRVEAIHSGADGLVEKPIEWESLRRQIRRLLDRSQAEAPRVLSVEDDPDQGAYLRSLLETAGYDVRIVQDAAQFEAALIGFRPDLVLMDILLPGVSGYDLARCLRQDSRFAMLPVLFLTTEQQLQVRIEAVKAGGDDHLVKPVPPGLLLSAVAARIERARFLRDLVERDGLTGLLTHTAFLERVRVTLARRLRRPEGLSPTVVLLDIDHFKSVNDTYGHPVGDRVLAALAAVLKRRLRQSDTIGRLGGDEFGVLLEDLTPEDAVRLVDLLRRDFAAIEHHAPGSATFRASFSAGVAVYGPETADLQRWLDASDRALYAAKRAGRDRVVAATTSAGA